MALLTDDIPSGLEDLLSYDSGVLDVARTEGVNLDLKLTIAWQELQLEVNNFLLHRSSCHGESAVSQRPSAKEVVVNSAIRRWHLLQTLALVYADLSGAQLNNRYQVKARQFEKMARDSKELAYLTGLGLVWNPIPRPAKAVVSVEGTGSLSGTFLIQAQYCGSRGELGAPSEESPVIVSGIDSVKVRIDGGQSPPVAGYHIYLRTPEKNWGRQTSALMPLNQVWSFSGHLVDGPEAGSGQEPDYRVRLQRILPKG